ncbi:hypothetical protein EON65_11915 [archaeon]|nr:MAG: hypothetical protein EON65_11915 [archaeon]
MEYFCPVHLTTARRPVLLDEEVEIKVVDEVGVVALVNNQVTDELLPTSTALLTNIRLIIVTTNPKQQNATISAWGINLSEVRHGEDCSGMLRRSTRVRIVFHLKKPTTKDIALKFHGAGKEDFIEVFHRTLAKRSWEKIAAKPVLAAKEKGFSVSNAGVSGLIRKQERNMENVDALTKTALTDLDALMNQARDAIAVVQRYAAYVVERKNADAVDEGETSETSSQAAETNEMESILQSIGIVSPITKNTAGRLYHEQLARQIADIMHSQSRLQRLGGLISLTDLYCLFNRARGSALVSPDDLLSAAERMRKLKLGVSLRIFPSGVKVIQLDSYNEDSSAQNLQHWLSTSEYASKGATAIDVASHMNVSLVLAKELLLIAEKKCLICRDESVQGLYFFPNLFAEYSSIIAV